RPLHDALPISVDRPANRNSWEKTSTLTDQRECLDLLMNCYVVLDLFFSFFSLSLFLSLALSLSHFQLELIGVSAIRDAGCLVEVYWQRLALRLDDNSNLSLKWSCLLNYPRKNNHQ